MNHGSLFSGIGGFDLAAEWMGWDNNFHCEWNPFGQKVLNYYWPNAESFNDITKTNFKKYANKIDVLTGGFPCQPYSLAGKRKGKEDERHLWPEMLRAIREIQPSWVVGENVFGLVNWSGGLVFHEVQADLEAAGYEVFPYVLPAAAVNAPHRRDRVWFVAYANDKRFEKRHISAKSNKQNVNHRGYYSNDVTNTKDKRYVQCTHGNEQSRCSPRYTKDEFEGICSTSTYTNSDGQHWGNSEHEVNPSEGREYAFSNVEQMGRNVADTIGIRQSGKEHRQTERGWFAKTCVSSNWENFPTESPICTGNDGFPAKLDGITFSKWRNESIKAAGNAIVPQVALQIFKSIEQYEQKKAAKF